ncbi:universal stress protein [Flavisolibacter sp. BT320]|nr:universal stress protein [Flavisolibacter longurius]
MKIIVPVDFSDVAVNAAEFTAQMLDGYYGATLVLFHMYRSETEEKIVENRLSWLKETLQLQFKVKMETKTEMGDDFIGALARQVRHQDADLVVMAVTDRMKIIEDSYSLQMIVQSLCPVLVVPAGFAFKGIRNVALACDFKKATTSIPLEPVKKILNLFRPQLHIVHVNRDIYISLNEEVAAQRAELEDMFASYQPEFHFITTYGFHESLRQFITDKDIDMVLTFPRKHSFFNYLLKGTNTRKLVYETEVPVLATHE